MTELVKPKYKMIHGNSKPITFFDIIDSKEKAWVLGWVFSDGSHNTSRGTLKLSLSSRDVIVLRRIKHIMDVGNPINTYTSVSSRGKVSTVAELAITNKSHMSQSLINLGVVSNKTHILSYPKHLPDYLNSHFIRGVFEGDGHVGVYREGKQVSLSITGYLPFLLEISDIVKKDTGVKFQIYEYKKNRAVDTASLVLSSVRDIKTLGLYMYHASSGLSLPRKRKLIYSIVHKRSRYGDYWKGRVHSKESREKMRVAKLGKSQSEATIAKRRASLLGRIHSESTKHKIRREEFN